MIYDETREGSERGESKLRHTTDLNKLKKEWLIFRISRECLALPKPSRFPSLPFKPSSVALPSIYPKERASSKAL